MTEMEGDEVCLPFRPALDLKDGQTHILYLVFALKNIHVYVCVYVHIYIQESQLTRR